MRNISDSGKTARKIRLRSCADVRSLPKGFSTMTRAPRAPPDLANCSHDRSEKGRWNSQIVRRTLCPTEFFPDCVKGSDVVVVSVHITQQPAESLESRAIDSAVVVEALVSPCPKLCEVPTRPGHTDDRDVEVSPFHHGLKGREDLLVRQIARCTEKDQSVRMGIAS